MQTLDVPYEELKASNEELLSIIEVLQSSTVDFETGNVEVERLKTLDFYAGII